MKRKPVKYAVKYLGDDRMDIRKNEIYDCIAELYGDEKTDKPFYLSVIDRSGDSCIYPFSDFRKVSE